MYKALKVSVLMLGFALAACSSTPDADTSGLSDSGTVAFSGKDDAGNHMPRDVQPWRKHVAVSTTDPKLLSIVEKLIRINLNVNLVPVPGSKVIIRVLSCSTPHHIKVCTNLQYASAVIPGPTLVGDGDCDEPDANCKDTRECWTMEQMVFRAPDNEDRFLAFVEHTLDHLKTKK